jgi:hypothetical protein
MWILASLGPPLLLVAYGVFKARESWLSGALWAGFGAGIVAAGVAMLLELFLASHLGVGLGATTSDGARAVMRGVFIAALPEEATKMAALLAVMLLLDEDRLRGLVMVAIAVGMGFAGAENMLYLLRAGSHWQAVALLRGGTAVPIHGVCALMMGALLLGTIANEVDRVVGLAMALMVPVALHGTYDTLLMYAPAGPAPWKEPATVVAMLGGGLLAVALCNAALNAAASAGDAAESGEVTGFVRWIIKRAARSYLAFLLLPVVASGYKPAAMWDAALLAVLPAVLTLDVLFGGKRRRPVHVWRPGLG